MPTLIMAEEGTGMEAEEETGTAAEATGTVVAETGAGAVIGAADTRHGIIRITHTRHRITRIIMVAMEDIRQLSIR